MKKIILGLLCLTLIMACEGPQSVTIKGKPGWKIPLGSPFTNLDPEKRLENQISPDKIIEMMGGSEITGGVTIYNYEGPDVNPVAQAYLLHYPIVKMHLDLGTYVSGAIQGIDGTVSTYTIPQFYNDLNLFPPGKEFYLTGDNGLRESEGSPTFIVPLADMAKLVISVAGKEFGMQVPYSQDFADHLLVKIPAFGMSNYIKGRPEITQDGLVLKFVSIDTEFIPQNHLNEDNELEVYIKITGPCSGEFAPGVVFEWETAVIHANYNNFSGKYDINNSLRDFLGQDVRFVKAEAFMYASDVSNRATLFFNDISHGTLSEQAIPDDFLPAEPFATITAEIPPQSLGSPIDLTETLNSDTATSLSYHIEISEWEIHHEGEEQDHIISIDLIILIPLEFMVFSSVPDEDDYVTINLGDVFPKSGNDLFLRTSEDDILTSQLKYIQISLSDHKNEIIDNDISILVTAEGDPPYRGLLTFSEGAPPIKFEFKDEDTKIPYPFWPGLDILLEKDSNEDGEKELYATLRIKRQGFNPDDSLKLDFSLTVELKTDINYTFSGK